MEIRSRQGRWRSVAAARSLEVQARGAREERERGAAHGEGRGNGCEDLGFQLILYYVITITAVGSKMDGQK